MPSGRTCTATACACGTLGCASWQRCTLRVASNAALGCTQSHQYIRKSGSGMTMVLALDAGGSFAVDAPGRSFMPVSALTWLTAVFAVCADANCGWRAAGLCVNAVRGNACHYLANHCLAQAFLIASPVPCITVP